MLRENTGINLYRGLFVGCVRLTQEEPTMKHSVIALALAGFAAAAFAIPSDYVPMDSMVSTDSASTGSTGSLQASTWATDHNFIAPAP
jgi:hypothetical protein